MRSSLAVLSFAVALVAGTIAEAKPPSPKPEVALRGAIVHVDRAPDGRGVQATIDMVVDAPIEVVERMVSDVERWHDWIPSMTSSYYPPEQRPMPGDGTLTSARPFETVVDLPWPLSDVHERLVLLRTHVAGDGVRYSWVQVRGDLRRNEGSFTLYPRGRRSTRVVYQSNFQLRGWVPMFLVKRAGEKQAPKFIENMQRRAALMAGSPPASSATSMTVSPG